MKAYNIYTVVLYNNFRLLSITNNRCFILLPTVVKIIYGDYMLKNLKTLRMQSGISQKQLADVIGVSQQSINKYENHSVEPDIDTLIALADFFGVSVDYLVGHSGFSEPVSQVNLTTNEFALIKDFKKLSPRQKESIQLIIKNYLDI